MKGHLKLTKQEILDQNINDHIREIGEEFRSGFEELKKYPKSVTIFGSSHATPANPHYRLAHELANRIAKELNYAVITGGGPGIMAAANLGAQEANGNSVGLTIDLPHIQHTNPYTTSTVNSHYFFTRKTLLAFSAEAYVFFPGGYGTFDELFNILTLMQTRKIPKVPIILIGKEFWNNLKNFMTKHMLDEYGYVTHHDLELFTIIDNLDKVMEIIKAAPISKWWENYD